MIGERCKAEGNNLDISGRSKALSDLKKATRVILRIFL